MRRQLTSFQLG